MSRSYSQRYFTMVMAFVIGLSLILASANFGVVQAQPMSVSLNAKFFDPYDGSSVSKIVSARAAEMLLDEGIDAVSSDQLNRTVKFLNKVKVDGLDVHASDGAIIKAIVNIDASMVLNKIHNAPITEAFNPVSVESLIANKNQRSFVREYWHSRDAIFKAVQDNKSRDEVIEKLVAHYLKYKKILKFNSGLPFGQIKLYFDTLLNDGQKILIAQDMIKIISYVLQVEKADHKTYNTTSVRKSIMSILEKARTGVEALNPNLFVVMPTFAPQATSGPYPTPYSNIIKTTSYSNGYKFDPPVTVTTIRFYSPAVRFKAGESIDNNVWTRAYENFCGIKMKSLFSVTDYSKYDLKVVTSIATDSLPDIIPLYSTLFFRVADSGRAKDLTPYYNQYLDADLKDLMEKEDGGIAYNSCYRNSQLTAIAQPSSKNPAMQWIRQDWLNRYNLKWPANINESIKIMKFFCEKNPGAPASPITFAFPITQSIESGFPNAFGAYRNIWIDDGKGGLMRSEVSTKWKSVLKTMADLYSDIYLDNNFALGSQADIDNQMVNQQYGFYFGSAYSPDSTLFQTLSNNKKANWKQGLITDVNGNPAKVQVESRVISFTSVNKKSKYPEALMLLANVYDDLSKGIGKNYKQYYNFIGADGVSYDSFYYPIVTMSVPEYDISSKISTAQKTSDFSKLSGRNLVIFDRMKKWVKSKSADGWRSYAIFKLLGSESTQRESLINNLTTVNRGWGPETPSWIQKGPDLFGVGQQYFVKIIRGDLSVETGFAQWQSYFKNNGGADATTEINDWWTKEGKFTQYIS